MNYEIPMESQPVDVSVFQNKKHFLVHSFDLPYIRWKHINVPIVLITGCYDLFHKNHYESLLQARGYALHGIVVAGINHNVSVRETKGSTRPIEDHDIRARNVLSTGLVDYAFIFKELTAVLALKSLRPEVYITFLEPKKLIDKSEIIALANMFHTALRISTTFHIDQNGERISTTNIIQNGCKK